MEQGLKQHCFSDPGLALSIKDSVDDRMLSMVKEGVKVLLPGLNTDDVYLVGRCLYANTVDAQWIVGPHPEDSDVILACGFNGEGFKHSIVVGEAVASIAQTSRVPASCWPVWGLLQKTCDPSRWDFPKRKKQEQTTVH